MQPTLDSAGHQVPRTKPTCLLHTWRPNQQRPFAIVFHLHQHESSRNLHLQYLAKNQSTQHCQSLITPGSDHPPAPEPHMVLNLPLMSALTTPTNINTREKKKNRNKQKETPTSDRKPKKGTEKDHLKKTSPGPLSQGQWLDTSETKLCSSKEHKPLNQSLKTTKSSPCTHASSPLNQCNYPCTNACERPHETEQLRQLSSHRSDRSPSPVRPVDNIAQHLGTTPVRPVPSIGQTDATWETTRAQK
jgi:hypothetical protein